MFQINEKNNLCPKLLSDTQCTIGTIYNSCIPVCNSRLVRNLKKLLDEVPTRDVLLICTKMMAHGGTQSLLLGTEWVKVVF